MNHPLQCRCGTIKGSISNLKSANRAVCYCKDCQAFARFLGQERETLDAQGGSDIVQILPKNVTFLQGVDSLACMRLSDKGVVRWYAIGEPKPTTRGSGAIIWWFAKTVLRARFNGDYKHSPFFRLDTGMPIVAPQVLGE